VRIIDTISILSYRARMEHRVIGISRGNFQEPMRRVKAWYGVPFIRIYSASQRRNKSGNCH